ncbi:hypothetical protein VP01_1540g4 [Puccinia sorghi]|uniref:Uncharacterized protein n=1 Tax=Puccinia sorghi TaxID=27349 RepID=A0A0L6VIB9_9BASI|nr:hypothetical protein VP01_1540g4 [Puccinia sorghi]
MSSDANIQALVSTLDELISKLLSKVGLNDDTPNLTNSVSPNQAKSQVNPHLATEDSYYPTEALWHSQTCLSYGQSPTDDDSEHARSLFLPNFYSPNLIFKLIHAFQDALYVHIKIIWNLLDQKEIPGPPHPRTLTKLNSLFSDAEQIASSAKNLEGVSLIPVKDIVTLKSLQLGRQKIGKVIINLDDFFVDYTQATLASLGLRIWGPNLDDLPQSLYKKACRQATLKYLRQAPAGGCIYLYEHQQEIHNRLISTYNHCVHFLPQQQDKREKKQVGKFCKEQDHKVIGGARDQFGFAQKLPKKYQKIISNVKEEEDTSSTNDDSSYAGEEIDLNNTSGDSEPDDNNYEDEENLDDALDAYEYMVYNEDEGENDDDNDGKMGLKQRYNAMMLNEKSDW